MRLAEALAIIAASQRQPAQTTGYVVRFARIINGSMQLDVFPETGMGEPPLQSEEEAWDLATSFASSSKGRYYNVVVTSVAATDLDDEQQERMLNRWQ